MKIEVSKESKESVIREKKTLRFTEDDLQKLMEAEIRKQFSQFRIVKTEFNCGMGQGQGYFEDVTVELLSERVEKT